MASIVSVVTVAMTMVVIVIVLMFMLMVMFPFAPFAVFVLFALMVIIALIPVFAHEIDRAPAGIVFGAMSFPVALVSGWNAQVDRLHHDATWRGLHVHGLRVNDGGWLWHRADIELSVKARLADGYGNPDILCQHRAGEQYDRRSEE